MEFSDRIKSVFDVCDSDGSGYITVDHLKELARDHFGADNEEVIQRKKNTGVGGQFVYKKSHLFLFDEIKPVSHSFLNRIEIIIQHS